MFRSLNTTLFTALSAGVLLALPAYGQPGNARPAIAPQLNLNTILETEPEAESFFHRYSVNAPPRPHTAPPHDANAPLFNDPPAPEGGWKGLARVLDALAPSVDTRLPLTASQITDRIETMLTQGEYDEALRIIQERKAQREAQNLLGADVQLLFLEGRALAALGRHNDAIAVYRDMTTQYPELPEPWNNLASEYVRQGKLDMAHDALETALASDPGYATAQLNLGIVQLMQATDSFQEAARLGADGAANLAAKARQLLQP